MQKLPAKKSISSFTASAKALSAAHESSLLCEETLALTLCGCILRDSSKTLMP
jgi:hypothetical protein